MATTYRRFVIDTARSVRDGITYLQTRVNFPLLGFDDPREPIRVFEGRANTADEMAIASGEGMVQAQLAIERVLNSEVLFAYSSERSDTDPNRPCRGVFHLTVTLDGVSYDHCWKTPLTYTFGDEAVKAAKELATAFKAAAGGSWAT